MINFDNAATTFPKPKCVIEAAKAALTEYGGNPGRGGHELSMKTARAVYSVREQAADFFGAEPENTVFTLNCTHALNLAIKGIMADGGHIIISSLEHNSVARPVYAMSKAGLISYDIADAAVRDEETVENFRQLIRSDTRAIVCTLASNVTGQILPYREIGRLCREHNIPFIADGAQLCGIMPLTLSDGINILCTAGHKGLFGAAGTGLLISDGKYEISPIMQGGGGNSLSLSAPDRMPESLECGTVNTLGILTLGAGINFVKKTGVDKIYRHDTRLCEIMEENLREIPGAVIYRKAGAKYAPILSFGIKDSDSDSISSYLSERGFALRGGIHCSPLAHRSLGTEEIGTVRFAPSIFNTEAETRQLCRLLRGFS